MRPPTLGSASSKQSRDPPWESGGPTGPTFATTLGLHRVEGSGRLWRA